MQVLGCLGWIVLIYFLISLGITEGGRTIILLLFLGGFISIIIHWITSSKDRQEEPKNEYRFLMSTISLGKEYKDEVVIDYDAKKLRIPDAFAINFGNVKQIFKSKKNGHPLISIRYWDERLNEHTIKLLLPNDQSLSSKNNEAIGMLEQISKSVGGEVGPSVNDEEMQPFHTHLIRIAQQLQPLTKYEMKKLSDSLFSSDAAQALPGKYTLFCLNEKDGEYERRSVTAKRGIEYRSREYDATILLLHTFNNFYIVNEIQEEDKEFHKCLYDYKNDQWFHDGPWRAEVQAMVIFLSEQIKEELDLKSHDKLRDEENILYGKIIEDNQKMGEKYNERHYKDLNKL
ncbi:hypothetical protein [Halobacillus yeomjeoni]|uniref:Uncharacterized protein n=1 Tax=Halobacillus yeomjeoni TaxID=311194 RepID=A0A931MTX0_9BACI|nr:hypothetical protein [Halobacillus yeomjeoni]MBH0228840.1 hypothetical protein [Halobacillus yeomjeoni]